MNLFNSHNADPQARATLAYLQYVLGSGLECSWDHVRCAYQADIQVHEWHNGRENGYVVHLKPDLVSLKQINIAFFEHRNHDGIVAVLFEAATFNPPTLADVPPGVYTSKGDVSHSVPYGRADLMARWIADRLEEFWIENFNLNLTRTLAEDRLAKLNDLAAKGELVVAPKKGA